MADGDPTDDSSWQLPGHLARMTAFVLDQMLTFVILVPVTSVLAVVRMDLPVLMATVPFVLLTGARHLA